MTATHHKLNIVWKVVRFTIAVRPGPERRADDESATPRRIAGERSRTHRIVNPRNGRLGRTTLRTRWRSRHVVNLHIA